VEITRLETLESFITLDGSRIRELAHTDKQSLAEATVPAGGQTIQHLHRHDTEMLESAQDG
jgi:hypothetical protein